MEARPSSRLTMAYIGISRTCVTGECAVPGKPCIAPTRLTPEGAGSGAGQFQQAGQAGAGFRVRCAAYRFGPEMALEGGDDRLGFRIVIGALRDAIAEGGEIGFQRLDGRADIAGAEMG